MHVGRRSMAYEYCFVDLLQPLLYQCALFDLRIVCLDMAMADPRDSFDRF